MTYLDTPLGTLHLETNERGEVTALDFVREAKTPSIDGNPEAVKQLKEYFAGQRRDFDLPVSLPGTEFQRQVWQALARIPYGETRSYGEVARQIGRPKAVRAVGLACGRNPVSIVIPCHRVVGSNGKLTGYGGGLDKKEWLLAFESRGAV